jgi:hypothetical protein
MMIVIKNSDKPADRYIIADSHLLMCHDTRIAVDLQVAPDGHFTMGIEHYLILKYHSTADLHPACTSDKEAAITAYQPYTFNFQLIPVK